MAEASDRSPLLGDRSVLSELRARAGDEATQPADRALLREAADEIVRLRKDVDTRPFPMQDGPDIPWFIAEAIYTYCYRSSGQTLERLSERGGFGWAEVAYLWGLRDHRDKSMPRWGTTSEQRAACRAKVAEGLAALNGAEAHR